MTRAGSIGRLADISSRQWGLVTSRQAASAGVSAVNLHRLVGDSALEVIARGVYFVRGGPAPELVELRAVWLQLQPAVDAELRDVAAGVVSHTSAALVHDLGDFLGDRYEFTLAGRRQTRRPDVDVHRGQLGEKDVVWVGALPVTTIPRTVSDLMAQRRDGGHVARVAMDALDRGLVTRGDLAGVVGSFAADFGLPAGDGEGVLGYFESLLRAEQGIWS